MVKLLLAADEETETEDEDEAEVGNKLSSIVTVQ